MRKRISNKTEKRIRFERGMFEILHDYQAGRIEGRSVVAGQLDEALTETGERILALAKEVFLGEGRMADGNQAERSPSSPTAR